MKRLDLVGEKFGDIEIIKFLKIGNHGNSVWLAQCKCGSSFEIIGSIERLKYLSSCKECLKNKNKNKKINKVKEYNKEISLKGETWTPVGNFEHRYVVSNKGRVASILCDGKYKILKHKINKCGYHTIGLYDGNGEYKKKFFMVHRLVAQEFIQNPNNYPQINHINGNKNDNYVENLEWCTASQNILHSFRIGLKNMNRCFKPIVQYDKNHNFIKKWPSIKSAVLSGYELSGIHKALNKTFKYYKGYIWEYESPNPRVKVKNQNLLK